MDDALLQGVLEHQYPGAIQVVASLLALAGLLQGGKHLEIVAGLLLKDIRLEAVDPAGATIGEELGDEGVGEALAGGLQVHGHADSGALFAVAVLVILRLEGGDKGVGAKGW